MIRSDKDLWAGLIYVFFGSIAIVVGRDYPLGTAFKMGPAYFPNILGALLMVIGAISIVRSFVLPTSSIGAFSFKGLALVSISIFIFGFLVRRAGLAIALPLLVVISAYASAKFRWGPVLLIAIGLTVFCTLVFVKGLGIPLPVLGPLFGG